jgi:hypothetical protein
MSSLLAGSPVRVKEIGATDHGHDYAISGGGQRFAGEYKSNASAGAVAAGIKSLLRVRAGSASTNIPLIIVPYMGSVGRQLCDQANVSWLDLCGNASITAPGLRIWIEGRPNQYSERGRPPNVFAPKSSRIARQLLFQSQAFQTQADLARKTRLADGYVSKIVRRLENERYIDVNKAGAVRPYNPDLLLDAWHDAYDFEHHRLLKGHVPARTGDELLQRVVTELDHEKLDWAATGLSAAWLYTNFAAYRLATVYMSSMPTQALLKRIEFVEESKGANLWLVLPDDEGVFQGSQVRGGIRCVSALQTFLDLKGHPERAKDAATELRRSLLQW